MKIELQNIKKWSKSVFVYLQKIKDVRDHLAVAGLLFEDDDIIILALKRLPADFNTFRCAIKGRENGISLKDLKSELLAEEAIIAQSFEFASSLFGNVTVAGVQSDKGKALVLDQDSLGSTSDQSFNINRGSSSSVYSYSNGSYTNFKKHVKTMVVIRVIISEAKEKEDLSTILVPHS